MIEDGNHRSKFVLEHSNFFAPEDLYRFIHLDSFEGDWEGLGLDDDGLSLLQIQIMLDPLEPPVIEGTGGVRKVPFSPPPKEGEKRKHIEVLYAVFTNFSVAVLAAADEDGEIEDILPEERAALQTIMMEIEDALERGR
jgi:hypothetical protein